jgi:hypothetical protein
LFGFWRCFSVARGSGLLLNSTCIATELLFWLGGVSWGWRFFFIYDLVSFFWSLSYFVFFWRVHGLVYLAGVSGVFPLSPLRLVRMLCRGLLSLCLCFFFCGLGWLCSCFLLLRMGRLLCLLRWLGLILVVQRVLLGIVGCGLFFRGDCF